MISNHGQHCTRSSTRQRRNGKHEDIARKAEPAHGPAQDCTQPRKASLTTKPGARCSDPLRPRRTETVLGAFAHALDQGFGLRERKRVLLARTAKLGAESGHESPGSAPRPGSADRICTVLPILREYGINCDHPARCWAG